MRERSVSFFGAEPTVLRTSVEREGGGDARWEADGESWGATVGQSSLPLQERDAEAGEGSELGADDHRADDRIAESWRTTKAAIIVASAMKARKL